MSKKKRIYKPKYKGVRYIAKALKYYQSKKYPNYNKALPDARKFLAEIKSSGQKVKLSSIWNLSRNRRQKGTGKKTKAPKIDKNLLEIKKYFELIDYPTWIARCSNEIWFVSNIIPDYVSDIQGGSIITYEEYFSSFVNYINSIKALTNIEDNDYETSWRVTCTEPYENSATKRWESKIITVDADGDEFDYGFDPKIPTLIATNPIISTPTFKNNPITPDPNVTQTLKPQSQNADRVKEIRSLISDLRQDVKDGLISKEDYSKLVKELIAKLDNGGLI